MRVVPAALAALLALTGCGGDAALVDDSPTAAADAVTDVTIESGGQRHRFRVSVASTPEAQRRGLMFQPAIPDEGGMLFAPYPADGSGPREASFWMRNTASSLDILFIRADGTIASMAEATTPYSEAPVSSGEPVSAVLELRGGRAAELGIAPGDRVRWDGAPAD